MCRLTTSWFLISVPLHVIVLLRFTSLLLLLPLFNFLAISNFFIFFSHSIHIPCSCTLHIHFKQYFFLHSLIYHHYHHFPEGLGVCPVPCSSRWSWSFHFFLDLLMFLRPFVLYCSACFGSLFVSILCKCCSHFFWFCFISFTVFCAPVLFV